MKLALSDVYAPIGPCSNCGAHLNLEATGWRDAVPEGLEVRCIRCTQSAPFRMTIVEKLVHDRLGLQTWLCNDRIGEFEEGCLVVGESLFATTGEKKKLRETIDEEGWNGPAAERLKGIEDREETVIFKVSLQDFDAAYHYAAGKHDCGFQAGQPPLTCKELVNWIYTSPDGFVGDYFTVYGLVMIAWNQLLEEIRSELGNDDEDSVKITNETEVRQRFKELLDEHNRFGYEIIWGEDRPVYILIDGKTRSKKPDLLLQKLVAIELKSFLRFQTYNAAGAKAEIEKAVKKLPTYDGVFGVAFMLCVSDKFTANELYVGTPPNFPLSVRWSLNSFA
jgi:hypothetical protein